MTPDPITLGPEDSLDRAIEEMNRHGFRHLPVVEEGRVVGMLSDRDLRLATSLLPSPKRLRGKDGRPVSGPRVVREVMTTPVFVLPKDAEVSGAVRTMVERRLGAIPVVREEGGAELVGIVTETDFLAAFLETCRETKGACDDLVRYHMRQPLPIVEPDVMVEDAFEVLDPGLGHLAVMEGDRFVGIVSQRDLLLGIARGLIVDAKAQEEGRLEVEDPRVRDVMTAEVLTAQPGDSLCSCAELLLTHRIGALPVVEEGAAPMAILTQSDILTHYMSLLHV